MKISVKEFDAIVVGAGGSGLRASFQLAQSGFNTAVITKVYPTRSHTVSAQGGIAAALGNVGVDDDMPSDDWVWHMYDTIKGSDYIGDQDSIEYMCENAPASVIELEHMGMPFSRLENGKIYQRAFGGMSRNFDAGNQAKRTCAVSDRTGHALLHTLFQGNIKNKTNFYNEWYATDIIRVESGDVVGVIAICMQTGEKVFFKSKITILATGGSGRVYETSTNAHINTGDGLGMVLRAGLPLQDMEFWQFHPTGIAGAGVLVTEGCRGEGGILRNKDGERYMERYAPLAKDLACRDVVSRSSQIEINEGRGSSFAGASCVFLDLTHIDEEIIKERLPGIRELSITFAGVDPHKELIPVTPTCHYQMGGIPTNKYGQVLTQESKGGEDIVVKGLYAVGECACVSVHGANRLGSNSLLDLVVFGRSAGMHAEETLRAGAGVDHVEVQLDDLRNALERIEKCEESDNEVSEKVCDLRKDLQKAMQEDFSVFREEVNMQKGFDRLLVIRDRIKKATIYDRSQIFNMERVEALELDNLMDTALATAKLALERKESRGAHSRIDYPDRDDKNWLKHSLYFLKNDRTSYRKVNMKPNKVEPFQPKERKY